MSLSIGIVGLPNVGKSTLFNALTKKQVDASNYPFCTIDPNVGVVKVPDERLEKIAEISKPEKIIHTTIEFIDIAGLVKDAHKGEGLGNQFLSHIRECHAICEVIRDFKDENVIHVEGKINPESDQETINLELIFADLQTVEKRLEKVSKETKTGNKEAILQQELLKKIKKNLEEGKALRTLELNEEEKQIIKPFNFLTLKPIIFVLNIDDTYQPGKEEMFLEKWGGEILPINAKIEAEVAGLEEKEEKEFLKELGIKESGLDRLIRAAYSLLQLVSFFTTGSDETRAWTVKKDAFAPQAASVIHTDFEKKFIKAEIINWQDLILAGSEQKAKEKGLIRTEGKDYMIKDGDICHFKI